MSSSLIAGLGSALITLLVSLGLAVSTDLNPQSILSICGGVLLVSFAVIAALLEFLFFRHIKAISDVLDKMEQKDYSETKLSVSPKFNPLSRINKEFYTQVQGKQAEIEKLKQMAKFRREFIADISHELKTPLFAAQGFVHTLLDGAASDDEVRDKFLTKAAKSLDGLDILIQDLLTISHIESGEIKMHFESFDIVPMALKVIDQMDVKAERKGMQVVLENEEDEKIYVHADYRRIYQVMTNLVSNAIKYTQDDSDVFIRFKETVNDIECSVKDRGVGIAQEDLTRVFERFYRVDKSRSKGGTGLGLAIVKHIMEGHGSQVQVESKVDKGSTFTFRLIKGTPTEFIEHDAYE